MDRITTPTIGFLELIQTPFLYARQKVCRILLQLTWCEIQAGDKKAKPWPGTDIHIIGRFQMPGYDVDQFMLSGTDKLALSLGFSHTSGAPLPGDNGNCVLATQQNREFNFLPYVKIGDKLSIETPDRNKFNYRITDTYIADKQHTRIVFNTRTPKLTLVTNYPFLAFGTQSPLRYIVMADLISSEINHD